MVEIIKDFIDSISSAQTIFTGSIVFFLAFAIFPKFFTTKKVAWIGLILLLGFLIFGMTDKHFQSIVAKPDNVPIVGMIFIFGYFTWYAMHKAVKNDQLIAEGKPTWEKTEANEKVEVYPYLIYIELVAALIYSIVLVVWAILLKAPLEEPANPAFSPNPSKAPWYFLGLQEMLVYYDPWIAGVLLPTMIIVGLCAIPYIDNDPKNSGFFCYKARRKGIATFLFGFWVLWILLIVIGTFLRGPNWNFFGPFEVWDAHKVVPLVNVNLSEIVFIKWMNQPLPAEWYIREAPGFLVLGIYFVLLPPILGFTIFKGILKKLGFIRYNIAVLLFLTMLALPIKMYLRWMINLKYFVAIPEYFFNI